MVVYTYMNEIIMDIANLIDHKLHHKNSSYTREKLLSEDEFIAIERYVRLLEKRVLLEHKTRNNNYVRK